MESSSNAPGYEELNIDEFEVPEARSNRRWIIKYVAIALLGIGALIAFSIWVLPILLDKVLIPGLIWVASRFGKVHLALLLVASLAIFPVLFIPSGPSMWLSGIIFGYGIGFCIIMAGTSIGQALPYFVGRFLFHDRIQRLLQRWPRKALALKAVESGGWFHQFRTVALLRVAPIPYTLFNYAITATSIHFSPYIAGSVVGMIPEAFLAIYSGRLLRTLADAKHAKGRLNTLEIVYNVVGFCVAVSVAVFLTAYGRRELERMEIKAKSESAVGTEMSEY